jgi:hypothetical protein
MFTVAIITIDALVRAIGPKSTRLDDVTAEYADDFIAERTTMYSVDGSRRTTSRGGTRTSPWGTVPDVAYGENDLGRCVVVGRGPVENNNVKQLHKCDAGHE